MNKIRNCIIDDDILNKIKQQERKRIIGKAVETTIFMLAFVVVLTICLFLMTN